MLTNSDRAVIAQTVLLEAEAEPWEGKLGVAHVVVNRMRLRHQTAYEVCWQPWQFSCWLDPLDKISHRFAKASQENISDSWKAVDFAWQLEGDNDITKGATHYLNVELTKLQRGGDLPGWVALLDHTVDIGRHSFYKEKS